MSLANRAGDPFTLPVQMVGECWTARNHFCDCGRLRRSARSPPGTDTYLPRISFL